MLVEQTLSCFSTTEHISKTDTIIDFLKLLRYAIQESFFLKISGRVNTNRFDEEKILLVQTKWFQMQTRRHLTITDRSAAELS